MSWTTEWIAIRLTVFREILQFCLHTFYHHFFVFLGIYVKQLLVFHFHSYILYNKVSLCCTMCNAWLMMAQKLQKPLYPVVLGTSVKVSFWNLNIAKNSKTRTCFTVAQFAIGNDDISVTNSWF